MSRPERQQNVLALLEGLRGIEPLKQLKHLFWSELNYQRVNQPLSRRGWTESASKALADDPVLFAGGGENNDFHVIYARLASDKLLLGGERPVVSRLLNEHPYTLFVFSNSAQDRWHFLNVKYDETSDKRRLFRRITVGPEERLRTASERISLLSLEAMSPEMFGLAPLTIQQNHDEAFDVEAVTKQFFDDFCKTFTAVAKDICERNKWMDGEAVERETQTLLNRLLFLYFIQRKGWMNRQRDYLYANFKQNHAATPEATNYYSDFLYRLFIRLSTEGEYFETLGDLPFLNGGLFNDEYGGQQRQESLLRRARMKIGNAVFRRVFDDLLEAYNFTVREDTPLNQEVAIDPEMLGKIFEALVLQLEQSDTGGKTSRHDTGSYYTQRPIVHYLCREGLRCWLEQSPPFGVPPLGGSAATKSNPEPAKARTPNNWPASLEKLLALDASDGIDADERATLDTCLAPEEARVLLERLDNLRACDPAVGSGAFPVGLLHEMLNLRRLCETRSRGRDPVEGDRNWLYDTKARIIERVIYGVDIQERAIEICKLRLWLSLMVDFDPGVNIENCSAKAFGDALKKVPALPNLDFKIRRANSLIDMVRGQPVNLKSTGTDEKGMLPPILNKIITAKREFYDAHKLTEKRRLRFNILDATAELAMYEFSVAKTEIGLFAADEDKEKLAELAAAEREMGWLRQQIRAARKRPATQQDEELERLGKQFDDDQKPTFVWQLDFAEVFHRGSRCRVPASGDLLTRKEASLNPEIKSESAGFDLLIGNPPWGSTLGAEARSCLASTYPEVADFESSQYFLIRSALLLNPNGQLGFIIPNTFALNVYAKKCRQKLLELGSMRQMLDLSELVVFAEPKVRSMLVLLSRGPFSSCAILSFRDGLGSADQIRTISQPTLAEAETWKPLLSRESPMSRLIDRLVSSCPPLSDYCDVRQGYIPYRTTTLTRRFGAAKAKEIVTERAWHSVKKESSSHERELQGGDVTRYSVRWSGVWVRYGAWVSTYLPISVFSGPRALVREITGRPPSAILAAYTDQTYVHNPSVLAFLPKPQSVDPKFIVGILNSCLMSFVFTHVAPKAEKGLFPKIIITDARRLPFPKIDLKASADKAEHDALFALVERGIEAKRENPAADTSVLEREIDQQVYALYGLTPEEIKIVEEASK